MSIESNINKYKYLQVCRNNERVSINHQINWAEYQNL